MPLVDGQPLRILHATRAPVGGIFRHILDLANGQADRGHHVGIIAASLTEFSLTARLAFMVVGPMVDVKLVALQAGTFGRRFALRFAPLTLVVAVASSAVIGWWLL